MDQTIDDRQLVLVDREPDFKPERPGFKPVSDTSWLSIPNFSSVQLSVIPFWGVLGKILE